MSDLVQEKPLVEAAVKTETPLHYFLGSSRCGDGKTSNSAEPGIVIREAALKGHLNLRGNPENGAFLEGVKAVLGVTPPTQPGTYETNGDTHIYWLGPNEWLAIVAGGTEAEVEADLRRRLQGHFSIVDVSGGQTLINLSGKGVATVLKKSSGYDFHPSHFGPGRCVQTTLAKATALVSKKADGSFDLVVRRSFADYLAAWLLDAGGEFGCRIEQGSV